MFCVCLFVFCFTLFGATLSDEAYFYVFISVSYSSFFSPCLLQFLHSTFCHLCLCKTAGLVAEGSTHAARICRRKENEVVRNGLDVFFLQKVYLFTLQEYSEYFSDDLKIYVKVARVKMELLISNLSKEKDKE